MEAGAPFSDDVLRPLLEQLEGDPRVCGVARLRHAFRSEPGDDRLLVVTTWDGLEPLRDALPGLADLVIARDRTLLDDDALPNTLSRRSMDARLLEVELVRIADLKPSARGERVDVLLDSRDLLAQWVEWSHGRPGAGEAPDADALRGADRRAGSRVHRMLSEFERAPSGEQVVAPAAARSLRHLIGNNLRASAARLPDGEPFDTLRSHVAEATAGIPLAAGGVRVIERGGTGFERFLAAADAEGFRGDRPLFAAAIETLRATAHAEPVFEEGFALPTFDQVEVRFGLGEAVGGCKPPLVPGVLVGVAVTPADDLAFWAAPCLRPPHSTVACVADPGDRVELPRTAGRDALFSALDDVTAAAAEELPVLLRRARTAHRQPLEDPASALRALHVPASFVAATERLGGTQSGTTRLALALIVARAGEDMCADVARAFGRAAGRLLLAAAPADDEACVVDACD